MNIKKLVLLFGILIYSLNLLAMDDDFSVEYLDEAPLSENDQTYLNGINERIIDIDDFEVTERGGLYNAKISEIITIVGRQKPHLLNRVSRMFRKRVAELEGKKKNIEEASGTEEKE